MAKRLIYLASPYSHKGDAIRRLRYELVCEAAAKIMAAGIMVYSPIAHTHSIAESGELPQGYDFWKELDERLIKACDELWVLMLVGWDKSVGTAQEIDFAWRRGMPVAAVEPGNPTQPIYEDSRIVAA